METKICTYSEPRHRLQLVRISKDDLSVIFEIRYNRILLKRDKSLSFMRLIFVNYVHIICINRTSPLSIMT